MRPPTRRRRRYRIVRISSTFSFERDNKWKPSTSANIPWPQLVLLISIHKNSGIRILRFPHCCARYAIPSINRPFSSYSPINRLLQSRLRQMQLPLLYSTLWVRPRVTVTAMVTATLLSPPTLYCDYAVAMAAPECHPPVRSRQRRRCQQDRLQRNSIDVSRAGTPTTPTRASIANCRSV